MSLKILVAEDDRHTRRILEHIFTKDPAFREKNAQILLAPDGEEALKIFERESPDLVISDLLMPRLDGFALCRAIRRLPNGKDVPIIVTSAIYKETALLNRMREELGVEFFAKPFQVRELVRGVGRLLDRRRRAASGELPRTATERATPGARAKANRQEGELSERPLAALLFDLMEEQVTGVLTLRRGRIKKEIFIIHGMPVGAESNIRTETLGHYLVAKHVLDEQQHQRALAYAKENRKSVREALVALGWLSEQDVLRHHTALVKLKIINSLRWHDGTYALSPGDTFSERIPKATIDLTKILFLGLQRVTSPDEVSRRLEAEGNRVVRLTARVERYRDTFQRVFGDEVLRLLPAHPTLHEMLRKGVDSLKVYLHTHSLLESGMAELGEAKQEDSPPVPTEDPIGLKQLKNEATRGPERKATSAGSEEGLLYEEIFGVDEISVVTAMPEPVLPPGRPPADSGEMDIDIQLDAGVDEDSSALSTEEARKLVLGTYLGIHDKTYYELLGVERTAGPPQIRAAFGRVAEQFDVKRFVNCDLGLDHPKLEEINHLLLQAHEVLRDPIKRATYDEDLRRREAGPRVDPAEAEERFGEGLSALEAGRYSEAAAAFARALEVDPESPDYHAYSGWATYLEAPEDPGRQLEAVGHLDQALALDPDAVSALVFYGRVCARTHNVPNAVSYLERALDLDPTNEDAFGELASIHTSNGDWKLLERLYRKVIHRLGSRHQDRVVVLWKGLADVYRERLKDFESARTALEVAVDLAPEDPEILRALGELGGLGGKDVAQRVSELRAQLVAHPGDPALVRALATAWAGAGSPDAAYLAGSVLSGMGEPLPPEVEALSTRFRPRFLIRIRRAVDADLWARIRDPEDDPDTGHLFEVLAALPTDFDLGMPLMEPGPAVPPESWPDTFARVVSYLADLLGMPVPVVCLSSEEAPLVSLHQPFAPVLGVCPTLLEQSDPLAIAVPLSLRLPYLWAGRAFGLAMTPKQLRSMLMAVMKLVAPRLKVEDPDGVVARLHGQLVGASAEYRSELGQVITRLTRERRSINLSRWVKGMTRSASRLALLVATDPALVSAHHGGLLSEAALESLRAFALSDDHLALRESLGTSISV